MNSRNAETIVPRNAVYANHDAKLKKFSPAAGSKAPFALKIFAVVKIFINSGPVKPFCSDWESVFLWNYSNADFTKSWVNN